LVHQVREAPLAKVSILYQFMGGPGKTKTICCGFSQGYLALMI